MRFMNSIIGGTVYSCIGALLVSVMGCNWEAPQQEESLPVTKDEVLGFWLHKNSEGESIIDLRDDGTYRQVCRRNSQRKPFFDSGWQEWTFRPKDKIPGIGPAIVCEKMMSVFNASESGGYDTFGEQHGSVGVTVFKYADGQVVLHSGDLDFKNPRPWGDWKRLSQDELPPYYLSLPKTPAKMKSE